MKHKTILLISLLFFNISTITAHESKIDLSKNPVIFLTGAAGFIGSNFLKYMFEKYPLYHFIVLDALTYAGNLENIPVHIKQSPRFEFWYGTVNDNNMVDPLMARSDFVIHFAAETSVTRSIFSDNRFFETDVLGTRVMMNSLVKNPNVKRFIHISTSEVYGTALSHPMDENHLLQPRSPYAAAKSGADRLVYSYWCTYNVPALIIRPFNNFGPNQHLEKVIPRFITHAMQKKPLTIHGDGSAQRDWLYVFDLCKALDQALHLENFNTIKNQVINIGSGKATSILEIAQIILKHFNLSQDYLQLVGDRPGQVECHMSSTKKARELLNWQSTVTVEKGLEYVIKWYKENKEWWKRLELMQFVPIKTTKNKIELH